MKTSDIKIIKCLLVSVGFIYASIILLGAFALFPSQSNLENQVISSGIAVQIALTGGLSDYEFQNDGSRALGVLFQILGIIAWGHLCPIILIYWKGKANELPDASGGFDPKNE